MPARKTRGDSVTLARYEELRPVLRFLIEVTIQDDRPTFSHLVLGVHNDRIPKTKQDRAKVPGPVQCPKAVVARCQ